LVGELITIARHSFPNFDIELHAYWASIISGQPRAIECAEYAWVKPSTLSQYKMGPADIAVQQALLQEYGYEE